MSDGKPDWIGDPHERPNPDRVEGSDNVRRCLHCGNDRTYRGVRLTGRFCSPECLRDHNREWGEHAKSDWRGIGD